MSQGLTSRKLAALICGLIATCTLAGFVAFGGLTDETFGKALSAVAGITISGIGAQAYIDAKEREWRR